eukprot:CAMPEP_0174896578 /NCGR_PEP_ID=MMETSP0167-20121228/10725_1 /TAXON_ID=38298 /ORGANISM="Rhodella maculata, Strain CCMP736" /LENGTH=881 /DNA_ID=CAMNT_0016136173 /DNA_START=140 /DNA_END=2785 /DNA_ORIENTATION=+
MTFAGLRPSKSALTKLLESSGRLFRRISLLVASVFAALLLHAQLARWRPTTQDAACASRPEIRRVTLQRAQRFPNTVPLFLLEARAGPASDSGDSVVATVGLDGAVDSSSRDTNEGNSRILDWFIHMRNMLNYKFDMWIELNEWSYFAVVLGSVTVWVATGALVWYYVIQSDTSAGPVHFPFSEAVWRAWSCLASSSTHTKEVEFASRVIGATITLGGLASFSLLTGTISASVKERMEMIRTGTTAIIHPVRERGHVVIAGTNPHLAAILRQLDDSRAFAIRDGRCKGPLKVVLLMEPKSSVTNYRESPRAELSRSNFKNLTMLIRIGSLSDASIFQLAGTSAASQIIVLPSSSPSVSSGPDQRNQADANVLSSLLALTAVKSDSSRVIVESSKPSTTETIGSIFGSDNVTIVDQSIASKMFNHFARQRGLFAIYSELLSHTGTIINVRSFPTLDGLTYRELNDGFRKSLVCGIIRNGQVTFLPPMDSTVFHAEDKVMVISKKQTQRQPPPGLVRLAAKRRETLEMKNLRNVNAERKIPLEKDSGTHFSRVRKHERTYVSGWASSTPFYIRELDKYVLPGSEVVILSQQSVIEREEILVSVCGGRIKRSPFWARNNNTVVELNNLRVINIRGNPLSKIDSSHAMSCLVRHAKSSQTRVSAVVCGELNWANTAKDPKELDNLLIMSCLLAEQAFADYGRAGSDVAVNLTDGSRVEQLSRARKSVEVVSMNSLMGLYTAQVAEHPYLNRVYRNLFTPDGAKIYVKKLSRFEGRLKQFKHDQRDAVGELIDADSVSQDGLSTTKTTDVDGVQKARAPEVDGYSFEAICQAARFQNERAIGIKRADGRVEMNPYPRPVVRVMPNDSVIVIAYDCKGTKLIEELRD